MVSTDALARGIDIGDIDYVVSYDCPHFIKTYIHRVGRTARAGCAGTAITIVDKSDSRKFGQMMKEADKSERLVEEEVDQDDLDMEAYKAAKESAAEAIKNQRQSKKKGPAYQRHRS